MKHLSLFLTIPALCAAPLAAQPWQDIKSVSELCSAYPDQVKHLFDSLNLDYPGLEKVKRAYEADKIPAACQALLNYYEKGSQCSFLRKAIPKVSSQCIPEADTILQNIFTVQTVQGQVPLLPDGHRNWYYHGPDNNPDWSWLSNRHEQLECVFEAYLKTGNKKYAEYMDAFLLDFMIKSLPYPAQKGSGAIWRGLEISYRAKRWPKFFYGMLGNPAMNPATRLLLLSSLPDHAHYNRHFHGSNNWLTMELSGLATIASYFPEYKQSPEWLSYAYKTMEASLPKQVYPDGVQDELSSHYHDVAARNFSVLKTLADQTGNEISKTYVDLLEQMFDYTAKILRPSGHLPLNNDSDRRDRRAVLADAAASYQRADWLYIITNGAQGTKPQGEPSFFYPWAGHLISRSSYDKDAHWSFFDVGPWGCAHEHNDKLHLSISAYGRDLLVDSGRFVYMGDLAKKFRPYATSSRAHNTIVFDGKGQSAGPAKVSEPIPDSSWSITPDHDFSYASFDRFGGIAGACKHTRMLYYKRGEMWIVVDKVATDRPRYVEVLWHFHPDCSVSMDGDMVRTDNQRGNLSVMPLSAHDWSIKLVKGQETPYMQGWYSEEYNAIEKNPTAEYGTQIKGDDIFVWLLYPTETPAADLQAKMSTTEQGDLKIHVKQGKSAEASFVVPLSKMP